MTRSVSFRGVQFISRLLLALALAVLVRSATIELNASLGAVWPFSLVRCDTASAPGCSPAEHPVRSRFLR